MQIVSMGKFTQNVWENLHEVSNPILQKKVRKKSLQLSSAEFDQMVVMVYMSVIA